MAQLSQEPIALYSFTQIRDLFGQLCDTFGQLRYRTLNLKSEARAISPPPLPSCARTVNLETKDRAI
ncbi:MAG: hypothetical protein VKJ46_13305 [Leptolyngbyaceae bacterium]|nr:hypothetical protein [Leptolyngbyaceae bacterium]